MIPRTPKGRTKPPETVGDSVWGKHKEEGKYRSLPLAEPFPPQSGGNASPTCFEVP